MQNLTSKEVFIFSEGFNYHVVDNKNLLKTNQIFGAYYVDQMLQRK